MRQLSGRNIHFNKKIIFRLHEMAVNQGQDLKKIQFKDQSWLGLKTRSRDATLSRHKGININELALHTRIAVTPSGKFNHVYFLISNII